MKDIKKAAAETAVKAGESIKKAGKTVYKKAGEAKAKFDEKTQISASQILDEDMLLSLLNDLYDKALSGIPKVSGSVDELADRYLKQYVTRPKAARALMSRQTAKCGASGFVTGLGGFLTMPVTIPANVASVLYLQIRMAAAIAKLGGFDIRTDETRALVYVCLTGKDAPEILKEIHKETARKFTVKAGDKLPNKMLGAVSHKVDFRFIVKLISKRSVRLVSAVPVAGGVFSGALDAASAGRIARNAYDLFIKRELPCESESTRKD